MPHSLPLITTLATALGLALILGFLALKIKLPALVGYLLAGILIGPFTPGFVANVDIAAELAEIGVMLLMFGVGLHFSFNHLLETRKIALPGALLQIIVATFLGACIATFWGWSLSNALVFGLALSVASTVVLIRALESQGLLGSMDGQIAVGWLVVEDIAMIIALVLLPFMARWLDGSMSGSPGQGLWVILSITLFKISSFIVLMLLVGRWVLPKLLWQIARTHSRELFTLCVIVVAISIAFGASKLFGISLALGAFFAGMVIRESKFSRRAAEESLPLRDAFAVLFFVAVGMLFNPYIFVEQPLRVLAVVGIIVVGKSIAAALLVLAFRYPLHTALTVSASLAQIGEFSFILAAHGVQLKVLPIEGQELILAGALISIAINPLIFKIIEPFASYHVPAGISPFANIQDPLAELPLTTDGIFVSGHVILVGRDRVGKRIAKILIAHGIPYVVVEQNRKLAKALRSHKEAIVFGSVVDPEVLMQAHIDRAGMLVVSTSNILDIRQMLHLARKLNPEIEAVVRVQSEKEKVLLSQEMKGVFFLSEEELAENMSQHVLDRFGVSDLDE